MSAMRARLNEAIAFLPPYAGLGTITFTLTGPECEAMRSAIEDAGDSVDALLEACEAAEREIAAGADGDVLPPVLRVLRAAIARARGER